MNLQGDANVTVGLNVGAMYDVNERITLGASFRTKMMMKVNAGSAYVRYANAITENLLGTSLGLINEANFKAEMPCPWVFGIGIAYKPVDRLTLAFDARLTGWNTYKSLDIEFLSEQLTPYNQNITKNYKNSWCYSLGAQYALTDRFDIRAGLMVDTSPVNKEYYNPETPGTTKIEPTVGFSFRPYKNLSVDFGFMYIEGLRIKNASCTYDDVLGATVINMLTQTGYPQQAIDQLGFKARQTFTADYKLHAFCPSIGVSYKF